MDERLNAEFGRLLRELRRRTAMSQDLLAEAAGVSRTSIVNIEAGRQGISLSTLYRLALALRLTPQALLPPLPIEGTLPRIRLGPETPESERAILAVMRRANEDGSA
jgi:transcriptional regulator with XRE-family HTH domain